MADERGNTMKGIITLALTLLIVLCVTLPAYALPEPTTAHYPRGGQITISPSNESTNTYAFKADGKTDNKIRISMDGAYAEECGTMIYIQVFVVNKWGNWIAFGEPRTLTLSCTPDSYEEIFIIREKKPFCIVISSYGISGECVLPYKVASFS